MLAYHDIFQHRHVLEKPDILKCTRNAELGSAIRLEPTEIFSIEKYLTLIGRQDTTQDVEHGGLARAIRTDDGVNVTVSDLQIHVTQRVKATEALGYALDIEGNVILS
jgi:hypothetical protein